jgi:tetratricopeptide (TPR) repeat protein
MSFLHFFSRGTAAAVLAAFALALLPAYASPPASADADGTPDTIAALREIVAAQKAALAEARQKDDAAELEDVRPRLQRVIDSYEKLLSRYPSFAAGWASYGLFLCDPLVEQTKPALALLIKANALDPEIPVVKNQIGVLLAEEGRPIEAFNYFLAASDLAPNEPLYHFQIGLVLDASRADFLKSKAWSGATLDKTILAAFGRAQELAPDRDDYAYRAAEAYYDLSEPRWEAAYAAWTKLENRLTGTLETQTVRLHRARVLWKQGLAGDSRELVATVTADALAGQKARLLAEFDADDAREAAAPSAK